jgi:pimeloyl-ACP methyl ester carboxylesterase
MMENFRIIGSRRWEPDKNELRAMCEAVFDRGIYPRGFVRQLAAVCAEPSRRRALRKLEVPTLVVHGSEDPLLPSFAGRMTARSIPGAEWMLIDGNSARCR